VMTTSGHIAGVVNPPGSKRRFWTNELLPERAEDWLDGATQTDGTWWLDWIEWIGARAGSRCPPRIPGSKLHQPICDAPGTYVLSTS
jgi:polyhydroxyalkanoate synthase subunit PhaC